MVTHHTPLPIFPAMVNQLRMIPKHVSLDARMLMDAVIFHSGQMRSHVIFQAQLLRGSRTDGGLFLDQNVVEKTVSFVFIPR